MKTYIKVAMEEQPLTVCAKRMDKTLEMDALLGKTTSNRLDLKIIRFNETESNTFLIFGCYTFFVDHFHFRIC